MSKEVFVGNNELAIKDANQLLENNPIKFLDNYTDIDIDESKSNNSKALVNIPISDLEHITDTLKTRIREYIHGNIIKLNFEKKSGDSSDLEIGIVSYLKSVESDILDIIDKYGSEIDLRYSSINNFYENVDYDINKTFNTLSMGNFLHIIGEIKSTKLEKNNFKKLIDDISNSSMIGQSFKGVQEFGRNFSNHSESFGSKLSKLENDLEYIWTSKEVRLAYKKFQHKKNIEDLSDNRPVFETDTTISRLNSIHSKIYGMEKIKVSGPALVGPPGWGKTQILVDYFRNNGIEPIQVDIDPGQSAFILMARPIVGSSEKYEYGPILQAMENNQPIIVNEFIELQEWTFLNGLLTCVPATDSEAGSMPNSKPENGVTFKNPKGWFYNTITSEWLRVRENFRLVFTANLGEEYGNSEIPPSLESRIGSGLFEINGLPANEIIEGIIWPHLSSKENGKFLLDDISAYRLHFFINNVYEKLIEQIRNNHPGEHYSLAIRELIDLCSNLNPDISDNPVNLDEAIMRSIVRPLIAKRKGEILDTVVSILIGSGFIGNYSEEIDKINSNIGSERLSEMIKEIKNPFSIEKYTKSNDIYKDKCFICGVTKCPVHGKESKQSRDYSNNLDELMKIGLDRKTLDKISSYQNKLVKNKNWELLIESLNLGNEISIISTLDTDSKKGIGNYLNGLVKTIKKNPSKAKSLLGLVSIGEKKGLIELSSEEKKAISENILNEWKETIIYEIDRNSKNINLVARDYLEIIDLISDFYKKAFTKEKIDDIKFILTKIDILKVGIFSKLKVLDDKLKGNFISKSDEDIIKDNKIIDINDIVSEFSEYDSKENLNTKQIINFDKVLDKIIILINSESIDINLLDIVVDKIVEKIPSYDGDNYIPIIRLVSKVSKIRNVKIDRVISNLVEETPPKLPNILNY